MREGLTAVVSVKLPQPQFEGQTKGKLNSRYSGLRSSVSEREDWVNSSTRIRSSRRKLSVRRSTRHARAKLPARPAISHAVKAPSIRAVCQANSPIARRSDPDRCELFLVEGESAGGTAKSGRDRRYQAILPLKGKILNVEKARYDKMLCHEEIRAMITAIGTGIGKEKISRSPSCATARSSS